MTAHKTGVVPPGVRTARADTTLDAIVARPAEAGHDAAGSVFRPYGLGAHRPDGSLVHGQTVQYRLRRAGYAAFEGRDAPRRVAPHPRRPGRRGSRPRGTGGAGRARPPHRW